MIDAPTDLYNGLFRRKVSEDGKYEIAIHPVLYGFRIRAGEVGTGFCNIDYCCQTDIALIRLTYSCVLAVMTTAIAENRPPFAELPRPDDKYYREPLIKTELILLASKCDLTQSIQITTEELESYRQEYFKFVFSAINDNK